MFVRSGIRLAALLGVGLAVAAVTGGPAAGAQTRSATPIAADASDADPRVCLRAHVQNIGWQGTACADDGSIVTVGTTGRSLRMEALTIWTSGMAGVCAQAHVQNIGWQNRVCTGDGGAVTVGTTGRSLRMEAVRLDFGAGHVCAQAHVQNVGWQGWVCGNAVEVGTTGQSLRMEALAVLV